MKTMSDFICECGLGCSNITVSTSIYSIEAVHAATYQFTGNFHILISPNANDSVTVIFEAKDKNRKVSEDLKNFADALIDHQIRLQLDKNNGKIRDLIVAHAFSPLDLHKEAKSL